MASFFKKLSKKLKINDRLIPGGTLGKYAKIGKIGGALALGPAVGPLNPYSMDSEVTGARGSARRLGASVDRDVEYRADEQAAVVAEGARVAAEGVESEAQLEAKRKQDEQAAARRRNKRFSYGYNRDTAGSLGGDVTTGAKNLLGG